ncbi:hypothetical protein F441_05780 [Phytophthora nicotianae CJ01A1]|uniref:Integrase zinc-binding domain-containing protein n=1 Tax=Phytophthora nicotianae CJ01A1 TaxID=1317063 RepID=W2XDE0_PHYNI|nr:hypothetical protein F441_05780 [Phytophthora nicotianae CJ01A1]
MALLNRHKKLTAKLRYTKYLHVVRECNAAADSLASESLETKVSKVVLSSDRKAELSSLNRIREVIYESVEACTNDITASSDNCVEFLDAVEWPKRRTFADFVQSERGEVSLMPRRQKKAQKRVRFADGTPADDQDMAKRTATSHRQGSRQEVRWPNLKAVLRGETAKLAYKVARNVTKIAAKFVLTADDFLYYVGARRRRDNERDQDVQLRLVVPTTMIQEVLQNCHDSIVGGHQGVVRMYREELIQPEKRSCIRKIVLQFRTI